MSGLNDEVKQFLKGQGASLVGIASPDRFDGAPRGHAPTELFSPTKSVISIGVKLPAGIVSWDKFFLDSCVIPTDKRQLLAQSHWYQRCGYETVNLLLERLGLLTSLFLEERGYPTIYAPATYGHHNAIMEQMPGFMSPISHRHAAVRAGLGEFGFHNLVVTKEFGPRIRFMTVMTAAPLEADPLIEEPICLRDSCMVCVNSCKLSAITPLNPGPSDRVFLGMPSEIDKWQCYRWHGQVGCQGFCMRICPVGQK